MPEYQNRDQRIQRIKARPGQKAYGMGLGIILLDDVYPAFPGDVRNPSAYPFPIQYEIAKGVDIEKFVRGEQKILYLPALIKAAQNLKSMGCRAILAECGYFSYFQREVAASVKIPTFLSSLIQVPMAQAVVGQNRQVGIFVANSQYFTDHHLESIGVQIGSNYQVFGMMDDGSCEEFDKLWTNGIRGEQPEADYNKAEKEFIDKCKATVSANPNLGAIVLECTGFPPFARALQHDIDLPIFSWGTLMDYAYSVVVHRDYYGHV